MNRLPFEGNTTGMKPLITMQKEARSWMHPSMIFGSGCCGSCLLIILLLFPAFLIHAQFSDDSSSVTVAKEATVARYPSLMWEIRVPGQKRPSYLYGSMHVSRKVAFHLGDTFFMAVKNVDVVALESNPAEWMENYSTSEYYRKMSTSRSNYLNKYQYRNFYRDLFFPDLPEVTTFSGLLSKRYNVMNHMLYRKSESMSDFEEKTYLDLFIFQAGAKGGKQVIGLEDFEISRKLVAEAERPPKKRDAARQMTREQSKVRFRYAEMIEDAYRKGDLDLLDSLSRMNAPYARFHTYMVVKRNELMVHTIDSVIQSGKSIFAACGAAHLPGDSGIIEMLRAKGYTLRPVTRNINHSQNKAKERIDARTMKLPFQTWISEDGDFSVELPGKLYSNQLFSEHGEYFNPDMINGSYYIVNRFPTYAPLRGHDADFVKARFDSLIYEFIPGRINHFHEIKTDGFPAYDITATINRGDVQRYRIVFTPLEVLVFKMSGPGRYVKKDKASTRFFHSITLNMRNKSEFSPVHSRFSGYSLEMPSYRIIDTMQLFSQGTKDAVIQGYDFSDSSYYLMIKGSYYDFDYIEEDTFELNFMAEQLAEQFKLEVHEKSPLTISGQPAIDFSMKQKGSPLEYHTRIAISGPFYYMLLTTTTDPEHLTLFFNSFRLHLPSYLPEDFYTYRDTNLLFEVTTVCDPPEATSQNSSYYQSYYPDDENEDDTYNVKEEQTYYFHHRSVELIKVDYKRYHKYTYFPTLDDLWKSELESINTDSAFIIRRYEYTDSGLVNHCYVELTDTNSSRVLHYKMIQKHGAIYKLSALTDSLNGPSTFISTFFETFSPFKDTLIGWSVFADKGEMFLNDLVSEDSVIRTQARNSLYEISFLEDCHAPLLMERIAHPIANEHTFAFRKGLITRLGWLKHPDIPKFLEKQYAIISDTVTLQLAILHSLASQKSIPAARSFLACLKKDLPLTSNPFEINLIFNQFKDSLPIAKALFPEIFAYTRYHEYEDNIFIILSELVDSNLLGTIDYQDEFDIIFRNARDAWKRQLASEEAEQDQKSEYFTGSRSWSPYGGNYNSRLLMYLRLLLPYWQTKPEVRNLADNILNTNTMNLKIRLVGTMLQKNLPIPDTTILYLSSHPSTMADFYKYLAKNKLLDHFDKSSLNQEAFTTSLMLSEASISERDSLVFIERKHVENLKGKGYLYFFKKKKEKNRYWTLCWLGIMPMDTTQVIYEDYVSDSYGSRIYDNDDLNELMDKVVKKVHLQGRKRAEGMSFEKESYYYLFF